MQNDTNMKNNKASGFTLIELSIVLIIIGLIIGGILAGQELIKSAEARGIMGQLDKYAAAVNAFRLKYDALPGDFAKANTMLTGAPTQGDGNGIIATGTPTGTNKVQHNLEELLFWSHLSIINVVEGSYTGSFTGGVNAGTQIPYLKNNRGGLLVYGSDDSINYYHLGIASVNGTGAAASAISTAGVLLPDTAYAIDNKIDDGVADKGIVRAMAGIDTVPTFAATACTVTNAATYNLVNTPGYVCQLRYRMP
ncbi:MAG: prepilin-type N-terminal cleavage/methylation domain-containing protein [Alphaproteobacteria bacterium]